MIAGPTNNQNVRPPVIWPTSPAVNFSSFFSNKRIFSGLLLGTLRNFNSQASREEAVAQQRRRNLEARIEERQQEEKADLKRERADLFRARRENQRMVRRIEQKIRSVDAVSGMGEAWVPFSCSLLVPGYTVHMFFKCITIQLGAFAVGSQVKTSLGN